MPAFDDLQKASITAATGTANSSAAVNLGRTGLVDGLTCNVVITDPTTTAVGDSFIDFEVTTDNGTTWRTCGRLELAQAKLQAKGAFAFPVGFGDLIPEQFASGDIDWRITLVTTVALAEQIILTAYLAGHAGFRGP